MTNQLLARRDCPCRGARRCAHCDGALAVARQIGYPVVIKPLDGNHGRGVVLDLSDDAAVAPAYDVAEGESRNG